MYRIGITVDRASRILDALGVELRSISGRFLRALGSVAARRVSDVGMCKDVYLGTPGPATSPRLPS